MAFSGTISQTVFDVRKVVEHSARICGVAAERLTPESVDIARGQLYMLLSSWANYSVPLWALDKVILPLYEGVGAVPTPAGTVDLRSANLRTLTEETGTDTVDLTTYQVELDAAASVTCMGVLWEGTAPPFVIERSDDGSAWTTVQSEDPGVSTGEWSWHDLDQVLSASFYRIRATSGELSVSRLYLGHTPAEISFGRLNADDWMSMPNKAFQSNRPLQYWLDREARQPVMRLWPVPNTEATTAQIVVWRHRHIMDVGDLTDEVEVPQRWYNALVYNLASQLLLELPEADLGRQAAIDSRAESTLYLAQAEERDKTPVRIAPNIGVYTA